MPVSVVRPFKVRLAMGCAIVLGVANLIRWVGWRQQAPALEALGLTPISDIAPIMAAMWGGVWLGLAGLLWQGRTPRGSIILLLVVIYAALQMLGLALWGQPRPWQQWGMQLVWYIALALFFLWALSSPPTGHALPPALKTLAPDNVEQHEQQ